MKGRLIVVYGDVVADRFIYGTPKRISREAPVISDYGYGVVKSSLAENLTRFAHGKPVTLDSRYDLLSFPGVTAATPNEEEAAAAAGTSLFNGDNDEGRLAEVAETLQGSLDC